MGTALGGPGPATASTEAGASAQEREPGPPEAPAAEALAPEELATEQLATVALVAQTPWVGGGGLFDLTLRVDSPAGTDSLEAVVTVFPSLATRSDFARTLENRVAGNPVAGPLPFPLAAAASAEAVPPGAFAPAERREDGTFVLHLPLQDPSQPRDPNRVLLANRDGVHPVRVELRPAGQDRVLDRFVTHLIHLPGEHAGPRLGLAMVLPVHATLALKADGTRRPPEGVAFPGLPASLDALRDLPLAVTATPETVQTLAGAPAEVGSGVLGALRRAAAQRPFVQAPYVPVNVPLLVDAGLQREVAVQIDRGSQVLEEMLGSRPDARSWVSEDPLDQSALSLLAARGVERVVVPEAALIPVDQKVTLTAPFSLSTGDGRAAVRNSGTARESPPPPVPAAAADPGLSSYFGGGGNPVLQAHRFLADLTVLFLDRPGGDRRGVVAMPRRDWAASAEFFQAAASGLRQNPVLEMISLDDLFGSVEPAREGSLPLIRRPRGAGAAGLRDLGTETTEVRQRLESLGGILGPASAVPVPLEERLLASQSVELSTTRQRNAYVEGVDRAIDSQLRAIRMPEGRSITLTARRGEIPVTFQNRTGGPVKVLVRVDSDKLEFPGGTTRTIDLLRRNTTERIPVVARTSGAFPLRITLVSPDGNLVVGRARLTVRSTAASGVSLIVSCGAALFLAVWWGRHALKGRRARKLVPT